MNLPGLLIEYLINGSLALIWLLSMVDITMLPSFIEDQSLLLVPVIYVLGMLIDFIAWVVTSPVKKRIRNNALNNIDRIMKEDRVAFDKDDYKSFLAEKLTIAKDFPDLDKELSSRSSRDRIARGLMLNMIPITICYWSKIHFIGLALFILSSLMWARFEHYNRQFEIRAAHSVKMKK